MSAIRQNFHPSCEAAINKQINMELYASYVYMAMAYHFDRDDVALKNHSKYFKKASDEERDHAQKFMEYQNKRGGSIVLQDVKAPQVAWASHVVALEEALALEKKVNESLLNMHQLAGSHNDAHLSDFLENDFLGEQVDAINELGKLVTNAKRCGDNLGVYQFDLHSM